jgi:hypothetical protein
LSLAAFNVTAQMQQLKTIQGKVVNYGKVGTLTTADATATHIDSIVIADNTAGLIEVSVVGQSTAGDGVTAKVIYRYKKVSGTLTLSAATNIMAAVVDTNLSGATFALAATATNNAQLKVTGKAATSVKWRSLIVQIYP